MHIKGFIITKSIPTTKEIKEILEPYNELEHDNLEFSWDWFEIGGRYGGNIKIKFEPENNEDDYFMGHTRNYKYFISNELSELSKLKGQDYYYEELDCLKYMGLRDNILYVDGGFYSDIIDFDITECYFVIDDEKKLYARELWKNHEIVEDSDFEKKIKEIILNDKFITIIDIHF